MFMAHCALQEERPICVDPGALINDHWPPFKRLAADPNAHVSGNGSDGRLIRQEKEVTITRMMWRHSSQRMTYNENSLNDVEAANVTC